MDKKEYIEREAVKEVIKRLSREPAYQHDGEDYYVGVCEVAGEIAVLPVADVVEVRHGEWICENNEHNYFVYRCSVCGRYENQEEPYCHCGAKMDGGDT